MSLEQEKTIRKLLHDLTGYETAKLYRNLRLAEDLEMDSLDCVEMVMMIEDEFDLCVAYDHVERIKTVNDLYHYVQEKA
jgi:acyl carrier protein